MKTVSEKKVDPLEPSQVDLSANSMKIKRSRGGGDRCGVLRDKASRGTRSGKATIKPDVLSPLSDGVGSSYSNAISGKDGIKEKVAEPSTEMRRTTELLASSTLQVASTSQPMSFPDKLTMERSDFHLSKINSASPDVITRGSRPIPPFIQALTDRFIKRLEKDDLAKINSLRKRLSY